MRLWRVVLFYVLIKNVSLSNGISQTQQQITLEMQENDWFRVNSSNAYFGPVTDERWETFTPLRRKGLRLRHSLSFSLRFEKNYTCTVSSSDGNNTATFTLNRNERNSEKGNASELAWNHYTLTKEANVLKLFSTKSEIVVNSCSLNFEPKWIRFDMARAVIIHNYDFYESIRITGQNERSYVNIPSENDSYLCISTFVSIDIGCYLVLTLELENETKIFNVSGFNEDNRLKTWKKIDINVHSKGRLYFVRGRQDDMKNGYWAIDDIKYVKCNSSIGSVFRIDSATPINVNLNETYSKTETERKTAQLTTPHPHNLATIAGFCIPISKGNESVNCVPPSNLSILLSAKPNAIVLTFNLTSCYHFDIKIENITFENHTSDFPDKQVIYYNLTFPVEQYEYYYVKGTLKVEEQPSNVCYTLNSKNKTNWIIEKVDSGRDILKFTTNNSYKDVVYIGNETFILVYVFNKTHNIDIYSVICTTENEDVILIIVVTLFLFVFMALLVILLYKYRHSFSQMRTIISQEQKLLSPIENGIEKLANVKINCLEAYMKNMLKDGILVEQLNSLPDYNNKRGIIALQFENVNKNKYDHYVPYDSNRVVLKKLKGVEGGDYYNASYIDGCQRSKAYIACQGPKYNTVSDFWRMIWQEGVNAIVMATNFMEDDQRMCAEYFPQRLNTVIEYGAITITLIKQHDFEHYEKRLLQVHYSRFKREIPHFHLKWDLENDGFYPNNALPVVKAIRKICEESKVPVVIHSGFGIDRTAVLILCDLALEMIQTDNKVNFLKITKNMREQRPYMLRMKEHYILAHLIVLEFIMEKENPFNNSAEISVSSGAILGQQLSFSKRLGCHDKILHKRKTFPDDRLTNELHPLLVDGYGRSNKYIALKSPSKNNVPCFWWIVVNQKIGNIFFLDGMNKNEKQVLYSYRGTINGTVLRIATIESSELTNIERTKIKILAYEEDTREVTFDSEVDIICLRNWSPKNREASITTILTAISLNNESKRTPILVACRDRASSGVFLALSYVLEKYAVELEIDICSSLRILRRSGDDFIKKIKHLHFIYVAVLEYLKIFESYQRIEEL